MVSLINTVFLSNGTHVLTARVLWRRDKPDLYTQLLLHIKLEIQMSLMLRYKYYAKNTQFFVETSLGRWLWTRIHTKPRRDYDDAPRVTYTYSFLCRDSFLLFWGKPRYLFKRKENTDTDTRTHTPDVLSFCLKKLQP